MSALYCRAELDSVPIFAIVRLYLTWTLNAWTLNGIQGDQKQDHKGQTHTIIGRATIVMIISSGRPMRQ